MRILRNLFNHLPATQRQLAELKLIILNSKEVFMASQTQIAAGIAAATTQLQKIGTESAATLEKVEALQKQIDAGSVSPELQAAFDELKAQVQKVDDLVPDAVEPPAAE